MQWSIVETRECRHTEVEHSTVVSRCEGTETDGKEYLLLFAGGRRPEIQDREKGRWEIAKRRGRKLGWATFFFKRVYLRRGFAPPSVMDTRLVSFSHRRVSLSCFAVLVDPWALPRPGRPIMRDEGWLSGANAGLGGAD